MSDIETLHDRLNRLVQVSASISGRERILETVGETAALEAMLLEISETQLARRVIFRTDQNKEISFEVASGRIFKLVEPTSANVFDGCEHTNLIDALLEQDGNATHLHELICAFISGAKTLKVETQFLREPIKSLNFGVSAKAVFPVLGASHSKQQVHQERNVLTEFLTASSAFSIAGLVVKEESEQFTFGRQANLALLREILLTQSSQCANSPLLQIAPKAENHCVIYSGHPTGVNSVLCASHGKNLALVIFESTYLDEILGLAKF